jgi:hypothetical protein
MNFDYCAPLMLLAIDEALLEEQAFFGGYARRDVREQLP